MQRFDFNFYLIVNKIFCMAFFKGRFFRTLVVLVLGVVFFHGYVVEPYLMLETEEVEIRVPKWGKQLDGLKIALVSDLHAGLGPHEVWRLNRIVRTVNAHKPDIVFLLGDYFNGAAFHTKMRAHTMAEILSKLNSPLGIYAIYGNHDFLYDTETVRDTIGEIGENMKERFKGTRTRDALSRARIELLVNSNARVHTPDGDFYVAGIADPITMSYSYSAAFKDIPEGYPVLFLTHTPGVLREIPKRAAISFAGHTHGGQIVIPRFGPISNNCARALPRRYAEGLYEMDGKMIYTTRGLGQSRIPFRFNCPPRITFVTIRSDWSDMEF